MSRAIREDVRRGWDSNPRNTLISVHRISNAAHSTNSDTSPIYHSHPTISNNMVSRRIIGGVVINLY